MYFTLSSVPPPEPMPNTVIATVLVSTLGGVALMILLSLIVGVVVVFRNAQSKQGG